MSLKECSFMVLERESKEGEEEDDDIKVVFVWCV